MLLLSILTFIYNYAFDYWKHLKLFLYIIMLFLMYHINVYLIFGTFI